MTADADLVRRTIEEHHETLRPLQPRRLELWSRWSQYRALRRRFGRNEAKRLLGLLRRS